MRRLLAVGGILAALTVGAAPAWAGHHKEVACPVEEVVPVAKPVFRLEVTQQTYKVQVPVPPKKWEVRTQTVDQERPCTKLVPVAVTDPRTGCTRTEYHEQTVMEKVRVTVVDVVPVCSAGPTYKTEERVRSCYHVTMDAKEVTELRKTWPTKGRHGGKLPLPAGCGGDGCGCGGGR
ncbi:MAG TPA: hypothetical protein VFA26_17450 [Gemmataceae bacterium]|nr:hypothetical protein [Gemmataceae bacterium]